MTELNIEKMKICYECKLKQDDKWYVYETSSEEDAFVCDSCKKETNTRYYKKRGKYS